MPRGRKAVEKWPTEVTVEGSETNIFAALRRQDELIASLINKFNSLEYQLEPVTNPNDSSEVGAKGETSQAMSSIASRLVNNNELLETLESRIRRLSYRIELPVPDLSAENKR